MSSPRRLPVDPAYLRDLFGRNAHTYDPVNLAVSLGLVRTWRRHLVREARIDPGESVLDAFCGPGSLGLLAARRLGPTGRLIFADLSPVMLGLAREGLRRQCRARLGRRDCRGHSRDAGPAGGCPPARFVQADVLAWRPQERFDVVLAGFALRYTSEPAGALASLARLLRPGGRLAVLEFTGPGAHKGPWASLTRWYFHEVLPVVAARLGRGREVYDYLSASSASFLTPGELEEAARAAGLRPRLLRAQMGGLVCQLIAQR